MAAARVDAETEVKWLDAFSKACAAAGGPATGAAISRQMGLDLGLPGQRSASCATDPLKRLSGRYGWASQAVKRGPFALTVRLLRAKASF
jgi:hypothetical protein